MSKQKPQPRPIEDHDRLVQEIDQQYLTKGLGVLDRRSGQRHSLVGNVGEALREATLREEMRRVIEEDIEAEFDRNLPVTEQEIDSYLEEQGLGTY